MSRTAKTLGFSVAPELKEEIEAMAAIEGVSKSALFREMVKAYKVMKKEEGFFAVQRNIVKRRKEKRQNHDFDEFFGAWNKEEADEFDKVIEEMFEQIDEDMWK
ncbi:MAG: ribbon-helix-helix domain-containing protein [Actinomycetota bacterium]